MNTTELRRCVAAPTPQHILPTAILLLLIAGRLFADEPTPSVSSQPAATTRVAMVPSGNCSGASLDAMSVAEAQLAASTQIKLLDRQTIDKTLQEHEITLGGLVDTDLAIKTGKILATDLLAVLEGSAGGDGKPQGIVVFDAKTGVRLCDETLAAGTPDRWPGDIATTVEAAVEKYRAPPRAVITLSIVGVRNVDMSAERDAFCEAIGRLLERELIRSSGVAILERQHLGQVLRERAISPEAPENALLASAQSIHLEITRYKQNGIGVAAILTCPAEKTHRVAAADEDSTVTAVVTNLSTEILKMLKAKPPQRQPNLAVDAERMVAEARSEYRSGHYDQAVVCAEAALAICPEGSDLPSEAAWHFANRSMYKLNPKMIGPGNSYYVAANVSQEDVEVAAASLLRCVDLVTQQCEYEAANGGIAAYQPLFVNLWYENIPDLLTMLALAPGGRTEKARQLSDLLSRHLQRFMLDVFIPAWPKAWQNEFTIKHLRPHVVAIQKSHSYLPTSKAWADLMIEHADRVVQFVDHRSPGLARDGRHAFSYVYLLMPLTYHQRDTSLWQPSRDDYQRLRMVFERMMRHRLPGMQIFGMSGLLWVDQSASRLTQEQVRDQAQAILVFAKSKMNDPGMDDAERVACYEALLNVVNTATLTDTDRLKLIDDILDFMLSRQEAIEGVVEMAAFPKEIMIYGNFYPAKYGNRPVPCRLMDRPKQDIVRAFQAVARLESLIASPAARFPDGCANETRSRTREALEYYARIDPKLIPDAALAAAPWIKARKLIGTENDVGFREEFLSKPVVYGDDVYVVVNFRQVEDGPRHARLMRISLGSGKVEQISKLDLPRLSLEHIHGFEGSIRWTYPLRSPQISDGKLYCATPVQGGIVVFPLDGSTPTRISEETVKGMPTDVFDDIVVVGKKIFALTSGQTCYVHWYDPDGDGWRVIASSRRAEKKTPLDVSPLTYLGDSAYDTRHGRIVFTMASINSVAEPGLYQFDVQTRVISKATAFDRSPDWISAQDGKRLWCTFCGIGSQTQVPSQGVIGELDMVTNRWREAFCLEGRSGVLIEGAEQASQITANRAAFKPPFAMIDGWLWSFDPLGRMSPDGKVVEEFRDVLEGKDAPYPVMTNFNILTHVPERRAILYGNRRSLWCLELPSQADPPPGATPVQ